MNKPCETPHPDYIQFYYEPLEDRHTIGEITFNNKRPHAGTLKVDGQLYSPRLSFGATFASGHVARNPGPVPRQSITLQVNGQNVHYDYHHSREIGRCIWGDRPIIEVESPDGRFWHFQYRPDGEGKELWHQLIPFVSEVPQPYGPLAHHAGRLLMVIGLTIIVVILANFGTKFAYSLIADHVPSEVRKTAFDGPALPTTDGKLP